MKAQTVRFDDVAYEYIQQCAARRGLTVSQFVREAAMACAWADEAQAQGVSLVEAMEAYRAMFPPPRRPSEPS